MARSVVCICIEDPGARRLAVAAVQRSEGEVRLGVLETLARAPGACDALVCDLSPSQEHALGLVQEFRAANPGCPVLIYAVPRPGVGPLLVACGRVPGVTARLVHTNGGECTRVEQAVEEMLAAVPVRAVLRLVRLLLPDQDARWHMFVEAVADRLWRRNAADRGGLIAAAHSVGWSLRSAERYAATHELPAPRELLGWLVLLCAAYAAERGRCSTARICRRLGWDSRALYRLRRRLLLAIGGWSGVEAGHEFDLAFLAFSERCCIPRGRAEQLLEQWSA